MFANAISQKRPEGQLSRLAGFGLCLAILSGCATTRPSVDLPEITTWELRQEVLGELQDWAFRGRIGVKAGEDGFNGKFNWAQTGDDFYATVSGPLGIGTVVIEGDSRLVSLTDKDGVTTVMQNPEAELYYRYGWTIPINSLRYWALGIEDPSVEAKIEVDESGHLVSLQQSDWTLNISRYRESAGQEMPRKLTASNPDTRVRMLIDQWMFYQR